MRLLKRADFNSDDVVEVSEIRRATSHSPVAHSADGHSLLVLLDSRTDWDSLAGTFDKIYGDRDERPTGDPRELLSGSRRHYVARRFSALYERKMNRQAALLSFPFVKSCKRAAKPWLLRAMY